MQHHPTIIRLITLFICAWLHQAAIAQNASCPANLDFEQGSLNNWEFFTGSCCPTSATTGGPPVAGRHTLMSGTGVDQYGGFPVVAPGGGNFSLMLGNNISGSQAERARFYIQVPNNPNSVYTLLYSYAVVMQDPNHGTADQPRFEVTVFDSATGVPIPCNEFQFVASASLPGFMPGANGTVYKPWSRASIDLSKMIGRTVAVDFTTGDCALGAHFGYAYVDVACNFFQSYTMYCPQTINYTLTAPPGFATYEWRDATLTNIIGTTQNVTIVTPTSTTKYAVILKPYVGFGCPDTLYTTFNISTMTAQKTRDTAVCKGSSVKLGVSTNSTSTPVTYAWSPAAGLSCTNCDSPMASPVISTKYYARITDKDGCSILDSIYVRVDENVYADLDIGDSFCAFVDVQIKNKPQNPASAAYLWGMNKSNGTLTSGEGTPSITAQWFLPGFKNVKLEILNGLCYAVDSADVYIEPGALADYDILKDQCVGVPVTLHPARNDSAKYTWSVDGHTIKDSVYKPLIPLIWGTPGRKYISLTMETPNGCSTTKQTYIGIHEYPDVNIEKANNEGICIGEALELQTADGYRLEYAWKPPQLFSQNGTAQTSMIVETSQYIYLDVTNEWECTSTDSFYVSARTCCDIFMPDAFTPNNDGRNDRYWSPDLKNHTLLRIMIANRRGEIVFDSNTQSLGWDGTINGKAAGQDTYNYIVQYLCEGKKETEKKGTFTLIR